MRRVGLVSEKSDEASRQAAKKVAGAAACAAECLAFQWAAPGVYALLVGVAGTPCLIALAAVQTWGPDPA